MISTQTQYSRIAESCRLIGFKRHWEVTSAIIQSEDEILASQSNREIYIALQLRMSISSEGAMSNLFDETMLNAKAWKIDIPPVHIAKILSANEEVRTGRAKSNFVFANFTLDGPRLVRRKNT